MIYRVDGFEIDTDRFELRRAGVPQKVEPQVFALIELLVSNAGRLVSKDELNLRIWGGRVVSEAVVNSRIRSARLALGDDGRAQRLIQTVHNRGFRFALPVTAQASALPAAPEPVSAVADSPLAARPSVAVLPFGLMGGGRRFDLVADALAHEMIVELSRLRWLLVIARGSSFRFRGTEVDLREAGRVLGVRYLLTGTVTVLERRSTVTVELCRAEDGAVLWADRFDGPVGDILEVRTTIAARVVGALDLRIPMLEAGRAAALVTENLDSWSAYHRGLWHMYRFNAHDNGIAAAMFDRAATADPRFARAYAGLSFTHFQAAFLGYGDDAGRSRTLARELAEKSMALDPLDPFVNLTLGRAVMLHGDLDGALAWIDRSVELSPNYAFAHYNHALIDAIGGEGDRSEIQVSRAIQLSPIDPMQYAMLATRALSLLVRDAFVEAADWADRAAAAPNAHGHVRVIAAVANDLAGRRAASERWAREVRRVDPGFRQDRFFAAFPFRDARTQGLVKAALDRLAL